MADQKTILLVDDDRELIDGLRALLDAGMQFSVASARSYFSIRKLFGDLELKLPIIEFNGAFLTDYATGRHLEINSLGQALGEELFDRIAHAGQRPFVCSFNGEEDCLHYDELINPGMVWYEGRRRSAEQRPAPAPKGNKPQADPNRDE